MSRLSLLVAFIDDGGSSVHVVWITLEDTGLYRAVTDGEVVLVEGDVLVSTGGTVSFLFFLVGWWCSMFHVALSPIPLSVFIVFSVFFISFKHLLYQFCSCYYHSIEFCGL